MGVGFGKQHDLEAAMQPSRQMEKKYKRDYE